MIFLFANVVFAIIGLVFIATTGGLPLAVAWICFVLGGITIASRVLAWTSGAAMRVYAIAAAQGDFGRGWRNRMIVMEALVWIASLANVYYFFYFQTMID